MDLERDGTRRSAIAFLDGGSGTRVDALARATIEVSSAPLAWPGVLVEAGRNQEWEVDHLAVAHHYLAMNLDAEPLRFEVHDGGRARTVTVAPGDVWACPAGEPFTHRVRAPCTFAAVTIAPERFTALAGGDDERPVTLRRAYGVGSPQLAHLVRALVAEAERGNPTGLLFADSLATAVAHQWRAVAGTTPARAPRARGGLSPVARRRALELLESRVADGITVAELARAVGLSTAHFARAFRESVGRPPHRQLLHFRLEHARRLLDTDASLAEIAARSGFADQAHLTRHFRRAFGTTPGAVRRAH